MKEIVIAGKFQIILVIIMYIAVLVFIFLDLWSGIRKAKQRGEFTSSYGLKKTIEKISKYMNMMLVLTALDFVLMLALYLFNDGRGATHRIPIIPVFTLIGTMFVGIIEFKSIYENNEAKEKAKIQDISKMFKQMMKDPGARNMLKELSRYVGESKKEDTNG